MKLKAQTILAAVIALSLALPGAAMADRRGHDSHKRDYYGGHSSKHHKRHHYNRHHYNRHHYRGHHGKHVTRYYKYDDDSSEYLLFGLVTGGLLGYALGNSQQPDSYDYDRYPPSTGSIPPAGDSYSYRDNSCLQEREYQTTVIVGGKEVEAYGTACLQPDGSWRRGPAQLASYQ